MGRLEHAELIADMIAENKTVNEEFASNYNCTNQLSKDGKYTRDWFGDAVLMCTQSLLGTSEFMTQIYGYHTNRNSDGNLMIALMKEMGVTVITSNVTLNIRDGIIDFQGNKSNTRNIEKATKRLMECRRSNGCHWDRTLEKSAKFVKANPLLKKLGWIPDYKYLNALQTAVNRFLSVEVMNQLYTLDKIGVDGSMFFVTLSLSLEFPYGGHANIVRFMQMQDVIEVYAFEPNGHSSTLQDQDSSNFSSNAAQKFVQLMIITLNTQIELSHKVVEGNMTCPRLQHDLPLCAIYAMYFAVLNHVLTNFNVESGFHSIGDLCNVSNSKLHQGSPIDTIRTRLLDQLGQTVQPEHTCTHDLVIMMLVAFYGIGKRNLKIRYRARIAGQSVQSQLREIMQKTPVKRLNNPFDANSVISLDVKARVRHDRKSLSELLSPKTTSLPTPGDNQISID